MRVITELFAIEHEQLAVFHSVDGVLNESTLHTVRNVITSFREWLGMHEGTTRIALSEKSIEGGGKLTHPKTDFRFLFSTIRLDERPTRS